MIVDEMLAEKLPVIGLEAVWNTYPLIDTTALAQHPEDLPRDIPGTALVVSRYRSPLP